MSSFLKEVTSDIHFELLIDTQMFSKDIVLKAAYNFLDLGYFFFRFDDKKNIVLEFHIKEGVTDKPRTVLGNYADELLDTYLRDKLEKDNKSIREAIVEKAINGPLDLENFVTLDTNKKQENEIDFDQDIDEILKEIEADPEITIDEEEIGKILQEIDDSASGSTQKPTLEASSDGLASAKDMFKKK